MNDLNIMEALNQIEKEKGIDKEILLQTIEKAVEDEYKKTKEHGEDLRLTVNIDRETGAFTVFEEYDVVKKVENPACEISLKDAQMIDAKLEEGSVYKKEIKPKQDFGRIAAQNARNVIVQKIREEERNAVYNHFHGKEKDIVTGVVQRFLDKDVVVSLDSRTEAILKVAEQIPGERFRTGDRIKLYVNSVENNTKGTRIFVSRKNKELVGCLFAREVNEIEEGIVEIKSIARDAGSRSKIAVYSKDENVDPVGACVGMNGTRVNAVVDELHGEKIDIINWDENIAIFIKNALSPSSVTAVSVDLDEESALVVVPDDQLSLAIGKEGQNARLAARLTRYKIDIKSESQYAEMEEEYEDEYEDDEYEDDEYEEADNASEESSEDSAATEE